MAKQPPARKRAAGTKISRTSRRRAPAKKKKKSSGIKVLAASQNAGAEARREAYRRAVRLYEQALEALQRRELKTAADRFQHVIQDFPDERELHERSRLYLQVCERESRPPPTPTTLDERVYAATLALNAGSEDEALRHLEAAVAQAPDSDYVQYMLAVTRATGGETQTAVTHLLRSIELNPDNRHLARQEPSFDPLREDKAFQEALKTPPAPPSSRGARNRSSR